MHIARALPTVADLACRARTHTRFLREIAADPQHLNARAALAAQLAAEHWEAEHGVSVGETVSPDMTARVAAALIADGTERILCAAVDRLNTCSAGLATVLVAMRGTLPLPEAEAMMDGIEDNLIVARVKLDRARAVLEAAI